MPKYIIKAARDQEYYIEYSTVVDAPICVYDSRAEAVADFGEERIARTDKNGTSSFLMDDDWNEERIVFREGAPPWPEGKKGWWTIPRGNLAAWCEAFLEHGDGAGEEFMVFEEFED